MIRRKILSLVTLLGLGALASSQPLNYAQATVEIKAGTLLLPQQRNAGGVIINPAPHLWFNLDQDNAVKPAKWTFVNPIAPTTMSALTRLRWVNLDPNTPIASTRLTKGAAPYWEVDIDTVSDEALAKYNILNITLQSELSVSPSQRDKLRRFMDQGGVLWVDLIDDASSLSLQLVNPLPFPFTFANSATALDANLFHPLMRFPNQITLNELAQTEYQGNTALTTVTQTLGNIFGQMEPLQQWVSPDSASLQPVAGNAGGSVISIARQGQGFMILTSRGVTANLNRGYPSTGSYNWGVNRGFYGDKTPADAGFVAAAKLAMNIISVGGLWTSSEAGPSHRSTNSVDLTAPLFRRFDDDQSPYSSGQFSPEQKPALYKGRMIVSKGDRLYVYDSRPDRDLDGDGNPDDGVTNTLGSQSDLVWVSPSLGTQISSPTVVEVPNTALTDTNRPNFKPTEQIWVVNEQSQVFIFDMEVDGVTNQGLLQSWPPLRQITPPSSTIPSTGVPYPIVIHESLAFMTDSSNLNGPTAGRVWIADVDQARAAVTNGGDWKITASTRMPEPSAAVTVGYIPIQDGSGGQDKVCYVPCLPSSSGLNNRPASFASVWLGARSESPIRVEYDGPSQTLNITTRASYFGLPIFLDSGGSQTPLKSMGLKISLIRSDGSPLTSTETNNILGGSSTPGQPSNGVLVLSGINSSGFDLDGRQTPGNTADDIGIRVDYSVEWGKAGTGAFQPQFENYVRGNLELPDVNPTFARRIIGSLALNVDGTVYVVTSFVGGNDPGGTLFGIRENKGPGNFSMVSRYEAYDGLTFNLNNSVGAGDQVTMPPVLTDEDQLVRLLPFLNRNITGWRLTSGPVVRGNSVYVMASGNKNLGFAQAPTGVMMAFKTNITTPSFVMEGSDTNFQIVQPDPALSQNKTQPEQYSVLQAGQFTVEPIVGTTKSRVVLNSLMNVPRGRIRDSINLSMPIIIRRGGQTDTLIEPEAISDNGRFISGQSQGRWNPLVWYMVFNGYQPGAGPIVSGQTLYQGGASILPSLISGAGFTFKGLIFALDADINPNDEFLRANTLRPWNLQLNSFLSNTNSFSDIRPANAVKWPQFNGIKDMDDLRIRILQATIEEDGVRAIAGGDDSLGIEGPNRLYGFSRSDFLVVDSQRIGRFDPVGNPLWTTDQTFVEGKQGPTTSFGKSKQLSEPNRMYSTGDNGYWVVDTGNNRVVRIDGGARELRTVERMKLDPAFKPNGVVDQSAANGVSAAESLNLKRPKDVLVFDTLVDGTVAGNNPFSNPQALERWTHMIIADSGNNRIVELVDRYKVDPVTGRTVDFVRYEDPIGSGKFVPATGVLYWHTPEELTGKDYRYNSIARTSQDIAGQRHNVVAFSFGNVEPGPVSLGLDQTNQGADSSSGFGGIVLYDGRDSVVIREFERPPIAQNTFISEDTANPGIYGYNWPALNQPARVQKLVGLNSVTVRYVAFNNALVLSVMVTDATGVYELVQDTSRPSKPWVVRWMMPNEAYVGIRHPRGAGPFDVNGMASNPRGLRAAYARRMDSGEVLIVNSYQGKRIDNTDFFGEVVLLDGTFADAGTQLEDPGYDLGRRNAGFNRLSVKFEIPPVQGVRGIIAPVFATRQ